MSTQNPLAQIWLRLPERPPGSHLLLEPSYLTLPQQVIVSVLAESGEQIGPSDYLHIPVAHRQLPALLQDHPAAQDLTLREVEAAVNTLHREGLLECLYIGADLQITIAPGMARLINNLAEDKIRILSG